MDEPSAKGIKKSESDQKRSDLVCKIVRSNPESTTFTEKFSNSIPKIIVQYWDDPNYIPQDVQECLKTWRQLNNVGYKYLLYDDYSARYFIAENFSSDHIKAYDLCYHPAMKSDYFRLCFILLKGGCYIDADDKYCGINIEYLFNDNRLKLQPLCFDVSADKMVNPNNFIKKRQKINNRIFYFNNNPLVAPPGDPILDYALQRATRILIESNPNNLPEIQSTTGPGNLTASLVAHVATHNSYKYQERLMVLSNWENYACTVWPLNYRNDSRNWRYSNRKQFIQDD